MTLRQLIESSSEIIGGIRCFTYKCPDIDFGPGQWAKEPDLVLWQDPHSSLYCAIVRSPLMGNLCGYVAVSATHPLFNKSEFKAKIECEKPINYANASIAGDYENYQAIECLVAESLWWFGFDCMHANDISPDTEMMMNELLQGMPDSEGKARFQRYRTYKDVAFVMGVCEKLCCTLSTISQPT